MAKEKGLLVAIYGSNNLGKTTLIRGVGKYFDIFCPEKTCATLKYPRYDTPTGKKINQYLREGNPADLTALQAQELYAIDRRVNEPELIELLQRNSLVVLEDYSGTGISWGVHFGISRPILESLNSDLLKPEVSLLVDGNRFGDGVELNHLHENGGIESWNSNRRVHIQSARLYNWITIDANQRRQEVLRSVLSVIVPILKHNQPLDHRPIF